MPRDRRRSSRSSGSSRRPHPRLESESRARTRRRSRRPGARGCRRGRASPSGCEHARDSTGASSLSGVARMLASDQPDRRPMRRVRRSPPQPRRRWPRRSRASPRSPADRCRRHRSSSAPKRRGADREDARAAAVVEDARPGGRRAAACRAIQRRHMPRRRMRAGAEGHAGVEPDDAIRIGRRLPDHVGTIQKPGAISVGPNCDWVSRTQSSSATAAIERRWRASPYCDSKAVAARLASSTSLEQGPHQRPSPDRAARRNPGLVEQSLFAGRSGVGVLDRGRERAELVDQRLRDRVGARFGRQQDQLDHRALQRLC